MLWKIHLSFVSIYLLATFYRCLTDAKSSTNIENKIDDEKKNFNEISVKMTDIIRLNVGGEVLMTTRKSLTSVSSSILTKLFNGRWDEKMDRDNDGHIFLDFNPRLFRYLLEQLRQYKTNSKRLFIPPSNDFSSFSPGRSYEKMLKRLEIRSIESSGDEILSMNVGGDRLTTRKKTLISRSLTKKNEHFIDADPSLFRTLVGKLRKQPEGTHRLEFEASTSDKSKAMNRMLKSFEPKRYAQITGASRWTKIGKTVAGSRGQGSELNQFNLPSRLDIDHDGTVFVADWDNHRIVRWKINATQGEVVAGGKGKGSRTNQLNRPTAFLFDRIDHSLIISDRGNRRILRCSLDEDRQNASQLVEVMITDVYSLGLAMDNEGSLYVSDYETHEVRRYGRNDRKEGTVVAGGNGQGAALNQLDRPRDIYVDQDFSIYVSDMWNHRIVKWSRNAKEGILIAGGQGLGNRTGQLNYPCGIFVDSIGSVYVADQSNNRVVRWLKDAKQGEVIAGENGSGSANHQLHWPASISLDLQGNLYVLDRKNNRIQRFNIL